MTTFGGDRFFWLGLPNQYGYLKICVSDDQGRFLYGVESKKKENGLGCDYNIMTTDGKGSYQIIDSRHF